MVFEKGKYYQCVHPHGVLGQTKNCIVKIVDIENYGEGNDTAIYIGADVVVKGRRKKPCQYLWFADGSQFARLFKRIS